MTCNDKDIFGQTALHIIAMEETCNFLVQRSLKQLLDHAVTRNIDIDVKTNSF